MARNRRNKRNSNNNFIEAVEDKKLLIFAIICIIIIVICMLTIAIKRNQDKIKFAKQKEIVERQIAAIYEAKSEEEKKSEEVEVKVDSIVNIAVVGDILCNRQMTNDAKIEGGYSYSHMFDGVRNIIKKSDYAIGTMETNFVKEKGISDYGICNSPREFAKDVKDSGIDLVSLAHNHALDYGKQGLEETNEYLRSLQYETVGIKDKKEKTYIIKEIKGLKIAFLSYTYGLSNEAKISTEDKQYVNIYSEELAKKEITEAKEQADFVIVIMHWGEINKTYVTNKQKEIAKVLISSGANAIVGSHPAVIEPMEVIKNEKEEDVFIAYSLGNYISNLGYDLSDLELVLDIQIRKDAKTGKTTLDKVTYTPVYMLDRGTKEEYRFSLIDIKKEAISYSNGNTEKYTKKQYDKIVSGLEKLEQIIRSKVN